MARFDFTLNLLYNDFFSSFILFFLLIILSLVAASASNPFHICLIKNLEEIITFVPQLNIDHNFTILFYFTNLGHPNIFYYSNF